MQELWHRRFWRRSERRALRDIRRNTDAKRPGNFGRRKTGFGFRQSSEGCESEKRTAQGLLDFEAVFLTWAESDPIMDRHEREH